MLGKLFKVTLAWEHTHSVLYGLHILLFIYRNTLFFKLFKAL